MKVPPEVRVEFMKLKVVAVGGAATTLLILMFSAVALAVVMQAVLKT